MKGKSSGSSICRTGALYDYFVICGLEDAVRLDSLQALPHYQNGDTPPPLERSYKGTSLWHFPSEVPGHTFDSHAVSTMCLPCGIHFRTQRHNITPSFHSFLITRADGSRCFGGSLIFYERVTDPKLCAALQVLQAMHLSEMSTSPERLGGSGRGRGGARQLSVNDSSPRSFSLPRHFRLRPTDEFSPSGSLFYDAHTDTLYVSKCIALLGTLPLVRGTRTFLQGLLQFARSSPGAPIEALVWYAVGRLRMPSPGGILKWWCWQEWQVSFRSKTAVDLPEHDFPLSQLMAILGIKGVLDALTCLLLEVQVLVIAEDPHDLMCVSEGLCAILFPFRWEHVYAPLLPNALRAFLDAPLPFLMGVTLVPGETPPALPLASVCIANVCHGTVTVPEDTPCLPHRLDLQDELQRLLLRHGLGPSDTPLSRLAAIARKQGVTVDTAPIPVSLLRPWTWKERSPEDEMALNAGLREVMLHRFVHLLATYEHFIGDRGGKGGDAFDKQTFLYDQPEPHQPFLARFLETQMFVSFLDRKLRGPPCPQLAVFDQRVRALRGRYGEAVVRTPSYEICSTVAEAEAAIRQKLSSVQIMIGPPLSMDVLYASMEKEVEGNPFPALSADRVRSIARGRRDRLFDTPPRDAEEEEEESLSISTAPLPQGIKGLSYASVAKANWDFVQALLAECKAKCKRLLVSKMGAEAWALGHGGGPAQGGQTLLEENSLVVGLCDLLERVWAHGCKNPQGKSALWAHLQSYMELQEGRNIDRRASATPPDGSTINKNLTLLDPLNRERGRGVNTIVRSPSPSPPIPTNPTPLLPILPQTLAHDISSVQSMQDIRTPMGRSRAFVKLALERKLLSGHLRTLLSQTHLLRSLYKRYAFVRAEDEREQLLCHLLSLNAVDVFCFLHTYRDAVLPYRIAAVPARRTSPSTLTASHPWVKLCGRYGDSGQIPLTIVVPPSGLPRPMLRAVTRLRNLGAVTSLCVGVGLEDDPTPWLLDEVVIREEMTGRSQRFPCSRWMGRGVDDDSAERLLVSQGNGTAPQASQMNLIRPPSPNRKRSPSVPRGPPSVPQVQQRLGDAVSALLKHFHCSDNSRGSVTPLLCGPGGLVPCLEDALSVGFKSARLFSRNLFLWEYIQRVRDHFVHEGKRDSTLVAFITLVGNVESSARSLGKDGKTELFLSLAVRQRLLHRALGPMSSAPVTIQLYEDQSFLRDRTLRTYLSTLLRSLDQFEIRVDSAVARGVEVQPMD